MIDYLKRKWNISFKEAQVKIFFTNGMTAEGVVISCDTQEMILKNINSDNLLTIFNPRENILMIKAVVKENKKEVEVPVVDEQRMLKLQRSIGKQTKRGLEKQNVVLGNNEQDGMTKSHINKISKYVEARKSMAQADLAEARNKLQIPADYPNNYVPPYYKK